MRPSKISNYMKIAEVISERSHDAETKVGAILINNDTGAILSTGFNGFIRGAPDEKLPNTRPGKYDLIVHAEQNLICNCAKHGISMNNCTLICTLSPCKLCMRLMINCGVTKVIARDLYRDFNEILTMPDVYVDMQQATDGFYHITYAPKE